ncbi:glycerophosphodiester phosphodiesterase family protein [Limosilactobacillus fermentum]|uniref:glycerophosphodiester phosphodiesterase n=1 Tax=Limosilactobacillus fermentum TaxID=1613 RepID=UPI002F26B665
MATTIFGHRGCPAHEPENSPAGFRYALTHGAEGIETDLHRTTNGTGQVADYTLAELRQFRLPNGECIPTLADFLQLVGTAPVQLNLEFKTDVERYPGIEETVLPLVKAAPLAKPVIFSSFWLKD